MKKIILTSVIASVLLYVGLIDFSYAKDLAKSISELTGAEMAEENTPMILAQQKSTVGNYKSQEPYGKKKVEEEEDEDEKEEEIEDEEDDDVKVGRGRQKQKEIQQEQKRLKREGNNDPQAK